MEKLWDKTCGECEHINSEEKTSWGNPCGKTKERKEAFNSEQKGISQADHFRFSPTLWVRPGWEACEFFAQNNHHIYYQRDLT